MPSGYVSPEERRRADLSAARREAKKSESDREKLTRKAYRALQAKVDRSPPHTNVELLIPATRTDRYLRRSELIEKEFDVRGPFFKIGRVEQVYVIPEVFFTASPDWGGSWQSGLVSADGEVWPAGRNEKVDGYDIYQVLDGPTPIADLHDEALMQLAAYLRAEQAKS